MTDINKFESLPKKKPWFLMTKKEKAAQIKKNIAHNKKLPPMGIDMFTMKLVPMPKNAK